MPDSVLYGVYYIPHFINFNKLSQAIIIPGFCVNVAANRTGTDLLIFCSAGFFYT